MWLDIISSTLVCVVEKFSGWTDSVLEDFESLPLFSGIPPFRGRMQSHATYLIRSSSAIPKYNFLKFE